MHFQGIRDLAAANGADVTTGYRKAAEMGLFLLLLFFNLAYSVYDVPFQSQLITHRVLEHV